MKFKKILVLFVCFAFMLNLSSGSEAKIKQKSTEDAIIYSNIDWWKNYNDPLLEEYILKGLASNHDFKIADLSVKEYNEFVKVYRGRELPTIAVGAGYNAFTTTNAPTTDLPLLSSIGLPSVYGDLLTVPLMASYEADIFGKNRDKTKAAKKGYEAAKYARESAYYAVSSSIATLYLNIVKLDKIVILQKEFVKLKKQSLDIAELRYKQGVISNDDLIKYKKSVEYAQISLFEYEKARKTLLNQFAVILGDSADNSECYKRTDLEKIKFSGNIPNEISSEVILQRPDVQKMEATLQKTSIDLRVARKELLPSVNLTGIFGYSALSLSRYTDWKTALLGGGVGLAQPLFTGGQKMANIRIKKIRYEKMLEEYQKTNLQAIQEVNDTLSKVKYDTKINDSNISKYKLEKQSSNIANVGYNEGVISKLDLLQKKELLYQIEKEETVSKIQCFVDYISLYKASGGKLN